MNELIARYAPLLLQGLEETLYMTVFSTVLAYVFGLPLGVLVYVTKDGGIHPNRPLNRVLSWFINLIRSVPFLILIVALNPISKLIAGTSIGPKSSIFALVVAAAPFVARMVESSLEELDTGVIEAAKPWVLRICRSSQRFCCRKVYPPWYGDFPSPPSL